MPDTKRIPRRQRLQTTPNKSSNSPQRARKEALVIPMTERFHVTPPSVSNPPKAFISIQAYGTHYMSRSCDDTEQEEIEKTENQNIQTMVENGKAKVKFLWLSLKPGTQLSYFPYIPEIANKFQKTTFCSKIGLYENLRNATTIPPDILYPVQTPRMYNLEDPQSWLDFHVNFHMTAVVSFLRWFITRVHSNKNTSSEERCISLELIRFALLKAKSYIKFLTNKGEIKEDITKHESEWNTFLKYSSQLVNEESYLQPIEKHKLLRMHNRAKKIIDDLRKIAPETEHDGIHNLWIAKPHNAACGRGIFINNNLEQLQNLLNKKYIVQKYIERPFLISNTKFDIRQWFLVTSLRPLEVWIYRESYIRFCSVPFDLHNIHESVHLSNNAIQKKYTKQINALHQNIWDSCTFQKYLKDVNKGDLWEDRIFPGMKDAITSVLLCSQTTFDCPEQIQQGWFEIYGADFMLTANLDSGPWLIEINESPAMDPSTPVTKRLCRQMLKDTIKVVVDWRENWKASTGGWQLSYRQSLT